MNVAFWAIAVLASLFVAGFFVERLPRTASVDIYARANRRRSMLVSELVQREYRKQTAETTAAEVSRFAEILQRDDLPDYIRVAVTEQHRLALEAASEAKLALESTEGNVATLRIKLDASLAECRKDQRLRAAYLDRCRAAAVATA